MPPKTKAAPKKKTALKKKAVKKVRQSAKPVMDASKPSTSKNKRKQIGQQKRMNMDIYIAEYPNHKLMLISELEGDVQRWIDAGAEPIPVMTKSRKVYEGINDKHDSKWVRFVGGETSGGATYYLYGLMMDPEAYNDFKHAPELERRNLIKEAMTAGKTDVDQSLGEGEMQTYAAKLPVGSGEGYNEIR